MQLIAALSNFVGAVVLALSLFTTSSDGADEGEMLAVWDNLFPCRAGEQGGIPLSNQCDGEAGNLLLTRFGNILNCANNFNQGSKQHLHIKNDPLLDNKICKNI